MKKFFLALIGILILAMFVGTTVFLYRKSQESPVIYQTATPFYTDIVRKTVATGKIVPRKEIAIKSRVPGVIAEIYVEAGQQIEKGEKIARIELLPDLQFLNSAESDLEKAKINLENAKRDYERQKALFRDKLISETDFNRYEVQYRLAEEAVRGAEDNVALIRDGATKKSGMVSNIVMATASGILLDVPVKEGGFVIQSNTFNEGTTIATVANMEDMIFEGRVDESEVGKLKEGMPLELRVGAIGDPRFSADLEYIAPKGVDDQGTIKFEIRAAVTLSADTFLRAGYSANADIVLEKRDQVLAINEANLIVEGNKTFVEVETGPQQFARREVVAGLSDGINIEIVSGLKENEAIKQL
jgi:RND family efflux transporter, MFP subunit